MSFKTQKTIVMKVDVITCIHCSEHKCMYFIMFNNLVSPTSTVIMESSTSIVILVSTLSSAIILLLCICIVVMMATTVYYYKTKKTTQHIMAMELNEIRNKGNNFTI